ncbi:MAG: UDP-N-acetylmuramate--L-alanine ligase [Bacteroidaceae bacterium]|nr:UDP-N-acetylmuramate--L-alanine ligase [Bacteroidaceae bacterium]
MNMEMVKSVYFIGIGGIGMSAEARYFLSLGLTVGGYDKTPSELTAKLIEEGARVNYDDDLDKVNDCFKDKESTLVVYTPAIHPEDNNLLAFYFNNGFEVMKRSQVLGVITDQLKGLCVAGTHGKTTTSTMTAHLLHGSHLGCNAFLGGISKNYHTNYLLDNKSEYVVIEADEYDRSFHWLHPYMTVITATDPDHLDIYGTKEAYLESFTKYTTLIRPGGALIIHKGLEMKPSVGPDVRIYEYSRTEGDFHAENIRIGGGEIVFDLVTPTHTIADIQLGVPVGVNIENGIAAMAMAMLAGATDDEIRQGMKTFDGVERRFDFKIRNDKTVFLSDYAHHPDEIRQCALSLKEIYGERKITALFQPHLYTRTRDFYKQFADSLSIFDEVILVDIYPAREQPIPGVTSALIYDNLKEGVKRSMCSKNQILDVVAKGLFDVLVSLGAGDIENYVPAITEILKDKMKE